MYAIIKSKLHLMLFKAFLSPAGSLKCQPSTRIFEQPRHLLHASIRTNHNGLQRLCICAEGIQKLGTGLGYSSSGASFLRAERQENILCHGIIGTASSEPQRARNGGGISLSATMQQILDWRYEVRQRRSIHESRSRYLHYVS